MIKSKRVVAVWLAFGIVVTGTAVLAFQAPQGDNAPRNQVDQRPASKPSRDDRSWRAVATGRIETARAILAQGSSRFEHTLEVGVLADIPVWSRRLMEDRLRLAATRAERVAAIREHRDRMRDVERKTDGYAKAGQARMSDALKASYYRLEADQDLVEEGVDIGQIELPALPKSGPAAPPR